jgi:hypothetical protein
MTQKSGFGRELSRYGMLEFVNVKSVRFYDKLVHQHHVEQKGKHTSMAQKKQMIDNVKVRQRYSLSRSRATTG